MQIDYAPAVRAYCQQRIHDLKISTEPLHLVKIGEIEKVINLIDGLEKQQEMLSKAFNPTALPELLVNAEEKGSL